MNEIFKVFYIESISRCAKDIGTANLTHPSNLPTTDSYFIQELYYSENRTFVR